MTEVPHLRLAPQPPDEDSSEKVLGRDVGQENIDYWDPVSAPKDQIVGALIQSGQLFCGITFATVSSLLHVGERHPRYQEFLGAFYAVVHDGLLLPHPLRAEEYIVNEAFRPTWKSLEYPAQTLYSVLLDEVNTVALSQEPIFFDTIAKLPSLPDTLQNKYAFTHGFVQLMHARILQPRGVSDEEGYFFVRSVGKRSQPILHNAGSELPVTDEMHEIAAADELVELLSFYREDILNAVHSSNMRDITFPLVYRVLNIQEKNTLIYKVAFDQLVQRGAFQKEGSNPDFSVHPKLESLWRLNSEDQQLYEVLKIISLSQQIPFNSITYQQVLSLLALSRDFSEAQFSASFFRLIGCGVLVRNRGKAQTYTLAMW